MPWGVHLHRAVGGTTCCARGTAYLVLRTAIEITIRGTQYSPLARRAGVGEVYHHPDSTVCADAVPERLGDGDLIVVKGSRGMHMGRVVRALASRFGETD